MNSFEDTAIWKVFSAKASVDELKTVRDLLLHAALLLDRVNETFPTYTLHSSVHAANVATLMGRLLGSRCEELTALEAAMLLLAAYWHDIGMVFDEAARDGLRDEPELEQFLNEHATAFLAVREAGDELPRDIAEWYCRWRHAERVYVQLDALEQARPEALTWGVVRLRDELANVCRSHNLPARSLHDPMFDPNFAAECDLRLCAILLRLADILDFDRTRSPETLYRYLGLASGSSERELASSAEWRKHHSSAGFRFPDGDRPTPYPLVFVAGPDDPATEYDLRQFLDAIESELREAGALLGACAERWQDLVLPDRIDRDQIRGRGYKYGEHRFTLERENVLGLFMGENLYESPYTFIRELLQNALDTSRHREFFERGRGNAGFHAAPIEVSEWRDRDGYRWVQVKDFGMGMTEAILTRYFLMVGRSYYRSDAFRADALRHAPRDGGEFCPISRFGIGMLSCFVVGDSVQVSTRHAEVGHPLRLSLPSLEGFYALQPSPMAASPMPAPPGATTTGYRNEPGTTIAVRLDARKESGLFDLRALLEEHLWCPPVPVEHDGRRVGGNTATLVDVPAFEHEIVELEGAVLEGLQRTLGLPLSDGLQLHILPLDLTAASPVPELRGQAVASFVAGSKTLSQALASGDFDHRRSVEVLVKDGELHVECTRWLPGTAADASRIERESLQHAAQVHAQPAADSAWLERRIAELAAIEERATDIDLTGSGLFRRSDAEPGGWESTGMGSVRNAVIATGVQAREPGQLNWGHNGVRLPSRKDVARDHVTGLYNGKATIHGSGCHWHVALALADHLRPELHVSRDAVRHLPWRVHSAANLALMRAVDASLGTGIVDAMLFADLLPDGILLGEIADDPLLTDAGGWPGQSLFGTMSANELIGGDATSTLDAPAAAAVLNLGTRWADFFPVCRAAVLALNTELVIVVGENEWGRPVLTCRVSPRTTPLHAALRLFPPLFCAPYGNSSKLKSGDGALNESHAFTRWLLEAAERLSDRYPGLLAAIRTQLLRQTWGADFGAWAESINASVGRLRELDQALAPPRSLVLTAEDFE